MTRVPPHWRVMPLGEVAETALGKMLDRGRPRGVTQVPYLRNVNVQWGRVDTTDLLTMEISEDERERFGVRAGDLLVCEGGEIGRAAIWPGSDDYIAYQKALHRVRPGPDLYPRFLLHLLTHLTTTGALDGLATGSTIRHLPQQQLRRLPVVLPPVDEQQRIVEILEDHLSRLDAANDYLDAVARRLRSLEVAVLRETVESTAERVHLRDLVARVEAGRSFGGAAPPARPDEWGVIKVSAMTWGEFQGGENKAVPADRVDARFEIAPGDLLVSRANTSAYVGASVLVRKTRPQLLLSDKSLRLVPQPGVDTEWLQLALSAPGSRAQISSRATGTKDSMRNISQASLLSIVVPQASFDEQRAQVSRVRAARSAMRALTDAAEEADTGAKTLRRGLLAAAFSGRLTGNSSDLDIAEEIALT